MSTRAPQRVFAIVAAAVFLLSSVAFSAFVIWEMTKGSDSAKDSQQIEDSATQDCALGQEASEAKTAPEAFKVEGDVTELQTADLVEGNGEAVTGGECLLVKYHGTLATTGEKFDGNFDEETALKLPIGEGVVIPGWDQGLIGMKPGGTRRLVIPSELAYGEQATNSIPANSDLVFVVELLKAEK